jgi:isoquinoline 1-oxidoreductase alpha subunit
MAATHLTINGITRSVDAEPDTPLLWILRDVLNLTGTKYGCGIGQCGACTVHVDGAPARACLTALGTVANKTITTIEGLSRSRNHPLQPTWIALKQAWLTEQVPQCGYCQPGMLMEAAALLAEASAANGVTDAEIDRIMGRHICRCGTYQRIRQAIHRAAQAQSPSQPTGAPNAPGSPTASSKASADGGAL